ncbi:MAG TPA: zf-HC2 domain-containing protein [Pyrinomonadaceae bacterium]|nr:zf-HC2 domain-containing protein [Pyrinomonadaceae bacterium]
MKCEQYTAHALEEFLDGELDARRAAETGAHLAACRACAARYDALLDEQAAYASYERDLDATPQALWTGIAARLAAEPHALSAQPARREQPTARGQSPIGASLPHRIGAWLASALVAPRFSPALTATMMLLAIGATAIVMRYMDAQPAQNAAPRDLAGVTRPLSTDAPTHTTRQPTPEATPQATPEAAPTAARNSGASGGVHAQRSMPRRASQPEAQRVRDARRKPDALPNELAQIAAAGQNNEFARRQRATERLVREAESKYLAAIHMLSEDVNRKRTRLDPQVAARFDETLATIDRSIAETRRTVLRQRNDPIAVQYMLSAYAKKVEVMREMAALD